MNDAFTIEAQRRWNQARRKAIWTNLSAHLRGKHPELLDFNQVAARMRLHNAHYKGIQNVPIRQIVGSVGRYQDFTGTFLPRRDFMGERWRRVAALTLDSRGGLPPIEVYKVGQWYFVKDGNHRVSVGEQIGTREIEAYVWDYSVELPEVAPDANMDALILAVEARAFFEKTRLDTLRPDHPVQLTVPGGYPELLAHIEHYQDALTRIDGRDVPYEEAVLAWFEMIYETCVQIIGATGVLELFPNRTTADFFLWVMRHRQELEARYGRRLLVYDAARSYQRAHLRARLRQGLKSGWNRLLRLIGLRPGP